MVVAGQLAEQLCETGVVGTSTAETHGEDGVDGDIIVVVVRVTRKSVVNLHLRVARADETQSERHSLADVSLAVVHQVADDEAQVAGLGVRGHLQATLGCVSEAVDFWEGHVELFEGEKWRWRWRI